MNQTVSTFPSKDYEQLFRDYYGDVQRYVDRPFQKYGGDEIAGFTPDQMEAFRRARAFSQANVGQDYLAEARGLVSAAADPISGQQIAQYMDPYEQDVINRNIDDLERARQMQILSNADAANRAGAFGGSRHALVESETNRGYLDAVARNSASLRSQGFANALNNANLFADRSINAAGDLRNLGLSARDFAMEDIELQNQIGAQQQNLNQDQQTMRYQNWLEQKFHPERMFAIQQSALTDMPYGQTNQLVNQPLPVETNRWSQALGASGLGYSIGKSLFPGSSRAGAIGGGLAAAGSLLF